MDQIIRKSSGGAQTPWASDINAADHNLTNLGTVSKTYDAIPTHPSNNIFNGQGGCDGNSFNDGDFVEIRIRSQRTILGVDYQGITPSNIASTTFVGNGCWEGQFDADDYATVDNYTIEVRVNGGDWFSYTGIPASAGTLSYHVENSLSPLTLNTQITPSINLAYYDSGTNRYYGAFSPFPAKFQSIYLDAPLPVGAGGTNHADGTIRSNVNSSYINFYSGAIYNTNGIGYDYANSLIYNSGGSAVEIDLPNYQLKNPSGNLRIDWQYVWLYDGAGNVRLTMNNQPSFTAGTATDTVLKLVPTTGQSGDILQLRNQNDSANFTAFDSTGKVSRYDNINAEGKGVAVIRKVGRAVAQNAAITSLAAYTLPAVDCSFEVSANVNVTTATAHSFTVTCTYTDETNTSRTLTFGFTQLSGATFLTAITNITSTGPYESPTYHIRCKASTTITIATVGTFTTVTYNVEGIIKQTA